jgi:hypothetical protein
MELQARLPNPAIKLKAAQMMPLRHNFTLQDRLANPSLVNGKDSCRFPS